MTESLETIATEVKALRRESAERNREFKEDIAEIKADQTRTYEQVKMTNGRVSALEMEAARRDGYNQGKAEVQQNQSSWTKPIITGIVVGVVLVLLSIGQHFIIT